MAIIDKPQTYLFLFRHAHSGWPSPGRKDFDRNLDDVGLKEARMVGEMAESQGLVPQTIICSTAARCVETIHHFVAALSNKPDIRFDQNLYEQKSSYYLALADKITDGQSVLLAGHNPMIEETFSNLAGESRQAADWLAGGYPTAGLAIFQRAPDGKWVLEALLSP
jgi:phosphohistidine phosphatase